MPNETQTLTVPSSQTLKKELQISDPNLIKVVSGEDVELEGQADKFSDQLLMIDPNDDKRAEGAKAGVETMAMDLQKSATKMSEMLKRPIGDIAKRGEDGGAIGKSLIDLKVQVEEIDPGKFDFEAGWLTRTLGRLPGVGSPIKRYFTKYESAQTVITAIVRSLENGRDQLARDNQTLIEDQGQMRDVTRKLERAVKLGQLIDQKISSKLGTEIPEGSDKHRFVSEELIFPLRQRIVDLQQQLAVNQQGVLAVELIVRNNKELVRGVNRALNVTTTALQVGATVAIALESQKAVLDKIETVSKTTSDLLAGTAARLKTQGVAIQKQASSAVLNMDSLKAAFSDINTAMNDLSAFRMAALPQLASTVIELNQLTSDAEGRIRKMEQGNQVRPEVKIELE